MLPGDITETFGVNAGQQTKAGHQRLPSLGVGSSGTAEKEPTPLVPGLENPKLQLPRA